MVGQGFGVLSLVIAVLSNVATPSVQAFSRTADSMRNRGMNALASSMDDTVSAASAVVLEELESTSSEEMAETPKKRRGPVMSQAIPFLEANPVLVDSDLAGNFGFDPLRLAKNKESLWLYREAEVKHARLAMLAAAGWPMSELLDRPIAEFFGVSSALGDGDRVPSLLNGGLEKISPVWWGFCLGLTASIDLYGVRKARAAGVNSETYIPGDLGFDPLNLYPTDPEEQKEMQVKEIKHGRIGMLAVVSYAAQEYTSKLAVVEETPWLFQPITETAEEALQDILATGAV